MRDICVTGPSTPPTDEQMVSLQSLLKGADRVRHGVCAGADEAGHALAITLGIPVTGHPGVDKKGKPKKQAQIHHAFFDELHEPKWFIDRNDDMAEKCTEVVALVHRTTPYRSGEWSTIRRAQRRGKPINLVLPDGTITTMVVA